MAKHHDLVERPFCDEVTKYEKLAKISQGTFGEVFTAKHCKTSKKVVLKKVLMENEKEGFPINHDFWSNRMPSDLKSMLSTHLTSMFEYLASPHRKGSQVTQQSTSQSCNTATTNQTEFERVF